MHPFQRWWVQEWSWHEAGRVAGFEVLWREMGVRYLLIDLWHAVVMIVDLSWSTKAHHVSLMVRRVRSSWLFSEERVARLLC